MCTNSALALRKTLWLSYDYYLKWDLWIWHSSFQGVCILKLMFTEIWWHFASGHPAYLASCAICKLLPELPVRVTVHSRPVFLIFDSELPSEGSRWMIYLVSEHHSAFFWLWTMQFKWTAAPGCPWSTLICDILQYNPSVADSIIIFQRLDLLVTDPTILFQRLILITCISCN